MKAGCISRVLPGMPCEENMPGLRFDQTAPKTQWTWGAGKGSWGNEPIPYLQGSSQCQQVGKEGRFWQVRSLKASGTLSKEAPTQIHRCCRQSEGTRVFASETLQEAGLTRQEARPLPETETARGEVGMGLWRKEKAGEGTVTQRAKSTMGICLSN